ncbi:MAG: hypothetical protein PHG44_07615 [Lentisphaeria bacterium]|nr:hypothetical protein [Lentisphaeria bacterium]
MKLLKSPTDSSEDPKIARPHAATTKKPDTFAGMDFNSWPKRSKQTLSFLVLLFVVLVLVLGTEKTHYEYKSRTLGTGGALQQAWYAADFIDMLDLDEELVAAIPLTETIVKNYGNEEYVTGLRSHTQTAKVILVSRRVKKVRFYQPSYWN